MMVKAADALEQVGFLVPNRGTNAQKTVGFNLHSHPSRFMLPEKKMALLAQPLEWITEVSKVDTVFLKSLMGIWVWAATLAREQLAIPNAIFQFLEKHFPCRTKWWPSVLSELRHMKNMVPALTFKISRPNWPIVFAGDAEGANTTDNGGFGIVVRSVDQEIWEETFRAGSRTGFTVSRLDGSTLHLRDPLKELRARIPVSKVPSSLLRPEANWVKVAAGRWKYREHITLGEGRTTLILLERLASAPAAHGNRFLDLCDNLPWCAATAKGRSPTFALNRLLQKRSSLLIASDIQLLHPWVDTHRMPADEISRQK
jgi:hypothetical protein